MTYQTEEKARIRRQQADQAIQLALDTRWEEAVTVNRDILATFANDVEAWNRLGKAHYELGQYPEAREAYSKAYSLDSANNIAKRNLERLATLVEAAPSRAEPQHRLDPQLFIEETGKTGVTALQRVDTEVLSRMTAGDQLQFNISGSTLLAETMRGEYLGEVEARLALRLSKLMKGGNQYVAAITNLEDSSCRIIIRETYQDPSQAGRHSFPAAGTKTVRPYTKEKLLRYGTETVEGEEAETSEEWDTDSAAEREGRSGDMDLEDYQRVAEGGDDDDDDE